MFKKNNFKKLFLFAPLMTLMFCFNSPQNDEKKMSAIMETVGKTLSFLHYNPKPINDAYSKEVYDKYFESVDASKRYFLQSDMDEFKNYEFKLDDYLIQGNLTFFNLTIDRLYKRVDEIDKMTQNILSKPINLDEDDVLMLEPKKRKNPANAEEQYNEWKKYIKYNILQEIETINSREEAQKKKKDSVIANKLTDTIKYAPLSLEQKRAEATKEVKDLITDSFKRFKKRKKMDWFTVYMNAYTEVFDPHTSYFSPRNKEEFDINFTGKIIGIGAIIQYTKGNLYLGELTIGAPAWKSKQLTAGDKILKVKSKPNEEPVNVVGMLSDEAVQLIRGEKETPVTLTVEKKDKTIKEVTMIREEVAIEDTFARSLVINAPNGKKYGFINLPSFNTDFNDPKGRNASDDILAELVKLKKQNIDGVILDLRNNGGGSLTEVGDIMGLFMNAGPYVQVKDGRGKVEVLSNKNNNPVWTGPLVIMQNELSASASEILAGAMQDYGRAVVVGSPSSFGKGTVQTFIDLNRFLNSNDDFGALKLTIQKFYRITGESTQRKGVESDVKMKDFYSYYDIGEGYDQYALPWDKIESTNFKKLPALNIKQIQTEIDKEVEKNPNYKLLLESAEWKKALDKEESISLKQSEFEKVMKQRKEQIEKFNALDKFNNGLKFTLNPDEAERVKKEEPFAKKTENWKKNLQRDFYLEETVSVLSKMK